MNGEGKAPVGKQIWRSIRMPRVHTQSAFFPTQTEGSMIIKSSCRSLDEQNHACHEYFVISTLRFYLCPRE